MNGIKWYEYLGKDTYLYWLSYKILMSKLMGTC
jgi:hypothetical protein